MLPDETWTDPSSPTRVTVRSLSTPASGEALPMNPDIEEGYRLHCVLSDLNQLDADRLDDADQKRVETAKALLEAVSLLSRPGKEAGVDAHADS